MTLLRLIPHSPSNQTSIPTQPQQRQEQEQQSSPVRGGGVPEPDAPMATQSANPTPTTTTTTSSSAYSFSPPLDPFPPKLKEAIQASREAETLHAYDVGVCAALQSMEQHWATRATQRYVSIQEKRIFRREAQRLRELLGDAQRDMMASDGLLASRQQEERKLWGEFTSASGREKREGLVGVKQRAREMEEEVEAGRGLEDIGELVDGLSLLSLGGKKRGSVRIEEVEYCEGLEERRQSIRERFGELLGEVKDGVKC
ncbi:hypothetical protein OQA88_8239 [Cercophora sp. LCS_1]